MKHVLVETNFLVSVLRPFPAKDAQRLLQRADTGELRLHIPWVSLTEVRRTLTDVIREDLGFRKAMLRFAVQDLQTHAISGNEMKVFQALEHRAEAALASALTSIDNNVDMLASKLEVIEPSKAVVARTMAIFPIKHLPPFDEMVLGAVLAQAESLFQASETDLWFCNLNVNDFDPERNTNSGLAAEYKRCGLNYLRSFDVP